MKRNVLKRWITVIVMPLLSLLLLPGLCRAGDGNSSFREGTTLLKQAHLDQAVVALTQAIRLAPDRVEAYNNRGLAYFEQKEYAQAKQDFFTALQLSPFDKQANNNLGILFCGRKDYDRALSFFQRAVEHSTTPSASDKIIYRNLAFIYAKKGMTEEAAEAYEKARSIQAKTPGTPADLRPYGESGRDYTLTLEFNSGLDHANGGGRPVRFFYDR